MADSDAAKYVSSQKRICSISLWMQGTRMQRRKGCSILFKRSHQSLVSFSAINSFMKPECLVDFSSNICVVTPYGVVSITDLV